MATLMIFALNTPLGKSSPFNRCKSRSRQGFTLIELLFALAITSSSLLIVLGLVPVGLNAYTQAKNYGISSQIAQQVFSQIQCTPFYALTVQLGPSGRLAASSNQGGGYIRYFDDSANEIAATGGCPSGAVFQVNVRLQNTTSFVGCSSPNNALALAIVQVAYNPGNLPMDMDSTGTMWSGTSSGTTPVPIFTFQTLVARNS